MANTIGIRREDKSRWERRAPLTPDHVRQVVDMGARVIVQTSEQRVFSDEAYRTAGAEVGDSLEACDLILGVKEIPPGQIEDNRAYMFFSHTIKGQATNMPLLASIMEGGCTLIDYERIVDGSGRRLIHFGRFAGLAGMIDSLWTLGRRLRHEGIENPFEAIRAAHEYSSLEEAKSAIRTVGERIRTDGLPPEIQPLVIGVTGTGNVTAGIVEILECLPKRWIDPDDLPSLESGGPTENMIYVASLTDRYLMQSADGHGSFSRANYRKDPDQYESRSEAYLPYLTVLMTGAYWVDAYPRLVRLDWLERAFEKEPQPRLRVIGDIALDIEGAIEVTVKPTEPDDPVYVYEPSTRKVLDGVAGKGPVILAVDFLPTELPLEASTSFGDALVQFMSFLVAADFREPFDEIDLPDALKRATIVHHGKLTPDFEYLSKLVDGRS